MIVVEYLACTYRHLLDLEIALIRKWGLLAVPYITLVQVTHAPMRMFFSPYLIIRSIGWALILSSYFIYRFIS